MSSKKKVDFLFDFGSPNAYLSHRLIPEIERRSNVTFEYVPILLGGVFKATNNQSPFEAFAHIRNKPQYEALETQRFVERHGLSEFGHNPHFPINTLVIMRGAIAARQLGVFEDYVNKMFHYMWADHRKLDDITVLMTSMTEAGLPAEKIAALSQDADVKKQLVDNTSLAVEYGVFGAPSFFVGDQLFFGKDRLRDVEEAARSESWTLVEHGWR